MIEERSSGIVVVNQPGGHIDSGESPERAAEREALEESGCHINVTGLLGVYLWIQPQSRQNFLRIVYIADLVSENRRRRLDDGIFAVHWYSLSDIKRRVRELRSPIVLRSVEDYLSGKRQPQSVLTNIMPIQQNVDKVLANAALI
jgi:8-oxo-dGTP pyrophosphatase MutT (NUDIX family)